jgi:beta-glucuronidase
MAAGESTGASRVKLIQYDDDSWQLTVDGAPYFIKGVEYSADTVGKTPQLQNEWMNEDLNHNGKADGPYDSFVDKNRDDFQDADEDNVGDFELLKEMGCNTIRIYHPDNIKKEVLRDLYATYGIRVIMGNLLGAYTVGSDADWCTGTDYTDAQQKAKMMENVRQMVLEHKDEPYVLLWMLGNENDSAGNAGNSTCNNTNAAQQPEAYARFVNDVSRMIKEIDPNHPVGVCNATFRLLTYFRDYAPDIDIMGMNAYTGPYGFGTLWNRIKATTDKPVLITEYGTDCYNQTRDEVDEDFQAAYHKRAWRDIVANSFWGGNTGNAIGGFAYCWLDKWWLCNASQEHDTKNGAWRGPTKDGWFNDEWLGLAGQGRGLRSPFLRQPRKVYFLYRDELWQNNLPCEQENE